MLKQKGLTLIELMIALVLSLLVTGMVISMFSSSIGGHAQAIRTMRLNQDMRITMDMIVRDIRRAGYWSGTTVASNSHASLIGGTLPIGIFDFQTGADNCVLVSYDHDADDTTSNDKVFGYRLLDTGVLQTVNQDIASVAGCSTPTAWQALIDDNTVQVNELTFTTYPLLAASFAASPNKTVTITLDASSLLDTNIRTVIVEEVRVRNEF
jgi:type IV pilus assembly protein PilW